MFEYNDLEFLENKLKTNLINGLSEKEAIRRQNNNGLNVLESKKQDSIFKIFIRQLKDPMIYILIAAIVISVFLKEISDAIVIISVVLLNAMIGTFQEKKTEKALEMLKKMSTHKCYVIRDGKKKQIDTSELVKGDLVCLESGNSVGADLRLIEVNNLTIDESSITGESNPVNKSFELLDDNTKNLGDKKNMAYMSTLVIAGNAKGIVVSTGMSTEIGKIAKLLKENESELTPLQKRLFDLGKLLGVLTIIVCVSMFIIAIIEKRNVLDMLISSISLAVAAIPEGLPAVVTIVLAIGVQRMIKVKTIVKRLPSVETLGSVSVVCSDKTGTLTENKLKCVGIYEDLNFKKETIIRNEYFKLNMKLCNNALVEKDNKIGSPIEIALLEQLNDYKINYKRIEEKEFDSTRKMMSTLNDVENKKIQFTKGAYDRVISKCKYYVENGEVKLLTIDIIDKISKEVDNQAINARRILSFAYKENVEKILEEEMIFLGFITFLDPPREGVKEAIEKFKRAGVKTVMITGDYAKTALAIGKDIGVADSEEECITGEEMDKLSDKDLSEIVDKKSIFARVSPLHKARIVTAFKNKNHIVAMTGDGVNDAPSLKKADIGISMGINGSDVAKEASDMILMDDNFTTIETAIEEGRTIYNNIKKSVLFLLSSNFAEIIVMLVCIIFGLPLPLLAIHVLVVNLLTDSIPALALGADNKEKDIMNEKPRKIDETLFAKGGLKTTIIYAVSIAMLTLVAFFLPSFNELRILGAGINLSNIKKILTHDDILLTSQTYAFIVLSLSEIFYSLAMRNVHKSIFRKNIFENKYLNVSIIGGISITGLSLLIPVIRNILKLSAINIFSFITLNLISASILLIHELVSPIVSHETVKHNEGI